MTGDEQLAALADLHRATRSPQRERIQTIRMSWGNAEYLGHADVTDLLLDADPLWTWEPVAWTEDGLPRIQKVDTQLVLWIRLTVHGHTRLGVGTVSTSKEEAIKELVGDALRNAAMRFGVALSLWSKAEWAENQ